MSIIYYDELHIQRELNDSINDAILFSKYFRDLSRDLSIPYDFKYKNYLDSLDNKISADINKLSKVQKKLFNSKLLYSKNNEQIENEIANIERYVFLKRQSVIK